MSFVTDILTRLLGTSPAVIEDPCFILKTFDLPEPTSKINLVPPWVEEQRRNPNNPLFEEITEATISGDILWCYEKGEDYNTFRGYWLKRDYRIKITLLLQLLNLRFGLRTLSREEIG